MYQDRLQWKAFGENYKEMYREACTFFPNGKCTAKIDTGKDCCYAHVKSDRDGIGEVEQVKRYRQRKLKAITEKPEFK